MGPPDEERSVTRDDAGEIEVQRARRPQEGETLGIVTRILGNERMMVRCADGVERMGRIRGKIKKRMWVRLGDIVIVSIWDFQPSHCDIVFRYKQTEVAWLEKKGFINEFLQPG
jgi:translation initiation factor 1A